MSNIPQEGNPPAITSMATGNLEGIQPVVKPKVQKLLKKTSFEDFLQALKNIKRFDLMMRKLGFIKSDRLGKEVKDIQD